jgi:hypothetical protein
MKTGLKRMKKFSFLLLTALIIPLGGLAEPPRSLFVGIDVNPPAIYPLDPDFTVKGLHQVNSDLQKMIDVAGDHKILFQEIGCPSATCLNSSEEKQARILEAAFQTLKKSPNRIMAANILWMSDIPETPVNQFGE